MAVAQSLRQSSDDFWAVAISTLGDDLTSEIDFTQESKQTSVDELLAATAKARDSLDTRSWSFTRNGKKVIVRDVLAKVAKWVNHFKEVGDIAVQYDPVHAALPWAGVRFLLNVAIGDINTYSSLLEATADIAELICRNALIENLLTSAPSTAADELRRALVKVYASILTYLAKARLYYRKNTATRVIKYGVLASNDLESTFIAITKAQEDVTQYSAILSLEAQFEIHGKLMQALKGFDAPVQRWDKALATLTDQLDVKRRGKILRWLSNEPYQQHHQQTHGEVMEGTGMWLLQDPTFLQWKKESASSILWLHGIPGSGKSKLTSIVVEDAQEAFRNSQSPAPVYFYCSRNPAEPGRSDPSTIMASIARQLSTPVALGPLLEDTVKVYQQREQDAFAAGPLRFEETKDLILKLLARYKDSTTTIVIDALDECVGEGRGRLLELLEDLLKASPCLLKIFISSRDDQDIVYKLDEYPNLLLSSDRNSADIHLFVQKETEHLVRRGELLRSSMRKAELHSTIVDKLTRNARGMFRWASLQLQELCRQRTDEAIIERLGRLPRTLEGLYQEILSRIESFEAEADRRVTQSAFSWLLCGQKQLKSECFLVAINLTKHGLSYRISKSQLLHLCCNLVIYDASQDAFRFSHLSVREFLESRKAYQPVPVNALVATACLYYFDRVNESHSQRPLREYSDLFWAEHTQTGMQEGDTILKQMLVQFLFAERNESHLFDWQRRVNIMNMRHVPRTVRYKLQVAIRHIPSVLLVLCAFDLAGILTPEKWTQLSTNDRGAVGNFHQVVAAKYGKGRIVAWQLERNIPFVTDENMVKAAAENVGGSKEVMALLLDRRGDEIQITEEVVKAAAANENGHGIMSLLLDRRGDEIQITEDVIKAAARNINGHVIMSLLLDRRGDEMKITEDVIKAAAKNNDSGQELMTLLLDRRWDEILITEEVVKAAAGNWTHGKEIMTLLLDRRGDEIQITEDVVKAAAENGRSGQELMTLFLDRRGDEIQITEDVVKAAAENGSSGQELMTLLLNRRWDEILITEEVVKAAVGNNNGHVIMSLLLDWRGEEIQITEDVVKAAARHWIRSRELMTLLLDRRGDEIQITEDVIKAAAKNRDSGQDIMTLLLDWRGDEIQITQGVVEAAAGNWTHGKEIMTLLLDRRGDEIKITEDVIMAVAKNRRSGQEIMMLLYNRRGDEFQVTEEAIKTAVQNWTRGKELMRIPLYLGGDKLQTKLDVVKAAAKDGTSGQQTQQPETSWMWLKMRRGRLSLLAIVALLWFVGVIS
ncbi:hypothetical protein EsH8_I_001000 [Colletotrichum jinshuiense]